MATEIAESVGSGVAIAKAIAGRAVARACHVCAIRSALWYCAADDAYLCTACDTQVHSANALSMRHERVRLTPAGTPKKRSSAQSNLVPEDGVPPRKRARTSRPYSHHLRKLTRLSSELLVEAKAPRDSESVELNFDFLDAGEFLCSDAEVPSVSPECSDVEVFAPDLDEFLEDDHTATSDSFTAFLKGKAAHSEHVAIDSSDQYLVPDAAFGDDICGVDTPSNVDLDNDAFFFPGDIPGLDAFESFAAPEMDLSDDFAITFDLALHNSNNNNPLDTFERNAPVTSHVTGGEPTESDQFMAGPFAKYFATKVKGEADEPMGAERIKREAREMLKCCEGERSMPCLQLDLMEVLSAWSDRGEPWMVDLKVPQMHTSDDSTSSGSDSAGLVPDLDGDRDARVMRYKEKRRTRLFSKKIRYEVRKLNAERRPRMKGRFVKKT